MTTDIRDLSQAKRLVTQLTARVAELETKLSTQTAEPYGYVLKTGHGTAFRENLAGVEPDFVKHWVRVFTHPAKTEQPSLSDGGGQNVLGSAETRANAASVVVVDAAIAAYDAAWNPANRGRDNKAEAILAAHAVLVSAQHQDSNKDAERYRFLREQNKSTGLELFCVYFDDEDSNLRPVDDLDAELDRAIAKAST